MTFLWSIHLYPPVHNCGSELMAHNISKYLISRGHRVRVLLNQAVRHNIKNPYEWEGVMVFPPQGDNRALFETSDVVLTHLDYTRQTIGWGKMFKRKVVHLVHNDSPYPSVINSPSTHVVYNSNWIKEKLGYKNNYFILQPPCDYRYYDVNKNTEESEYITLINLDWNKGGEILTKIAQELPEKKFIGVAGSYSYDSRGQFIKQPPNVKVVNNTPDILSIYRQTRVLIMPSHYESWGRTATEAICSGIPVIASRTAGLNENLDYAGLYVDDRNDIDQWVRWIKRLDDKKFYSHVSAKSRERSRELDPEKKLSELEYWLTGLR